MAISFTPAALTVDSEVLRLLEAVSRNQGLLSAQEHSLDDHRQMEAVAAIDAVHFSTKIEGNHLSRDQVTRALQAKKRQPRSRDLREILNYSRARKSAKEWVRMGRPFSEEWVLLHHKELLQGIVRGKLRGHYREARCVIQDSRSGAVVYMAADARDVPPLMKGLLRWLREQSVRKASALLTAAQFHFQLVTIHPFMDGNGRLARLLSNGILLAGGYEVERFAALEKQHEMDRAAYYRALRSLQAQNYYDIPSEQDIRPWAVYWLKCLLSTYEEALERVSGARPAMLASSSLPFENRLKQAESLFHRHRRLRAAEYADLMGLARTQAVADLNRLVDAGILERVGGGRSTVYRIRAKGLLNNK
jgi:Fic family protein